MVDGFPNVREDQSSAGTRSLPTLFFGPDLILLSIGLLASTDPLKRLLEGRGIQTHLGDSFGTWFWIVLISFFVFLLFSILLWKIHKEDERAFAIFSRIMRRRNRSGELYNDEIWEVDWTAALSAGATIWIILIGNLLGVLSVVGYASFVFFTFV